MFECPECLARHDDPSDARLGLRVTCLDCALATDIASERNGDRLRPAA